VCGEVDVVLRNALSSSSSPAVLDYQRFALLFLNDSKKKAPPKAVSPFFLLLCLLLFLLLLLLLLLFLFPILDTYNMYIYIY
jgi:hypothetical protein